MDLDDEELDATRIANGASKPKNTSIERIWKTKEEKSIKVKDMTTQHIENCIKCIEEDRIIFVVKLGYEEDNDFVTYDEDIIARADWLKVFKEELKRRKGEIK